MVILTNHAKKRLKQRKNLKNLKSMNKIAVTAFLHGIAIHETKKGSYLHRYFKSLASKEKEKKKLDNIRILDDTVYVFRDLNVLLTIFFLPEKLKPEVEAILNKKLKKSQSSLLFKNKTNNKYNKTNILKKSRKPDIKNQRGKKI